MQLAPWSRPTHRFAGGLAALLVATSLAAPGAAAESDNDLERMRALQARIQAASAKAIPATVHVRLVSAGYMSQGSGVIVDEDGLILTAAHVIGSPGRRCTLTLHDGRTLRGVSLGLNQRLDCGMIRIVDTDEEFAHIPLGDDEALDQGDWCIALGHPNGYVEDRPPVVRIGRLQPAGWMAPFMRTDCAIISGDSGGPLVNLDGEVVGIHSRIQARVSSNYHVGTSIFEAHWDRMLNDDGGSAGTARLGVRVDDSFRGVRLDAVFEETAAAEAGLQVGDVILRFEGRELRHWEDLGSTIRRHRPGDEVELLVQRGRERLVLDVVLGSTE